MNLYQRLIDAITELQRVTGNMIRVGMVEEVYRDKLRVWMANDPSGKKVLSPWLHTGNHRGGARERRLYKKGQLVAMFNPGGDERQGILVPYAPNKNFLPPNHASDEDSAQEEVWQLDDLRVKKTKDVYTIFLLAPQQQQQQSGDLKQMPEHKSDIGTKARAVIKIHTSKGITVRKDDLRLMVGDAFVKLKADKHYALVRKNEEPYLICSEAWQIVERDPTSDDDTND